MPDTVQEQHGIRQLHCAPDGPTLSTEADAVDLVGAAFSDDATLIVIPAERLAADFFDLSSGVAGRILQKLVNYRLHVAVVGSLTRHLDRSAALRAFVDESNRGRHVWFLPDLAELDARLAQLTR